MPTITVLVLLIALGTTRALPLTKVHVKFVSPPNVYEHDITTHGDRTVSQRSFVSIGRRSTTTKDFQEFGQRINRDNSRPSNAHRATKLANPESLWPVGVFIPPIDINDLGYSWQDAGHRTPDFSNGLEYHDPLLLTGQDAIMAVKYLYGHGELFYNDFPHERALLRNQEERRQNGLHGHILGSLRPSSLFYRKGQR
ncbi:hypothetical protein KM043_005996 [Ampulex compressa]|nr:hypothetical protein KM043_005996 [Ampulex compressa]